MSSLDDPFDAPIDLPSTPLPDPHAACRERERRLRSALTALDEYLRQTNAWYADVSHLGKQIGKIMEETA